MKYPRCKVCLIIPNASTLRGPIDLKLYYNYLNKVQIQFREKFLALQNMTTSLCSSPQLCGEFYLLSARCFGFHGLHFPCCSSKELFFKYNAAQKKKKKKKKALINPLYSTCLAPNSRHKQLANSWWTKWSIQQLKEQDISLRNWWQMNPKPKRTIDIGCQKHDSKWMLLCVCTVVALLSSLLGIIHRKHCPMFLKGTISWS